MIKALFFDIDGTLLSFDTHTVPDSTLSALHTASERGVRLFVATGRHITNTECVSHINFDGYITANGGYCITSGSETVHKSRFSRRSLDTLFAMLRTEPFPVAMMTERGWFCNMVTDKVEALSSMVSIDIPQVTDIEHLSRTEDIIEMCLYVDEEQEKRIVSTMGDCVSSRWNPITADLNPSDTDKAVGIEKMLTHFGLDREESMAFGDGGNDISMLRYAGIGVAMGSASEQVRKAADYVTDEVDRDGICKALKHFNII